jgi:hypothetical protein
MNFKKGEDDLYLVHKIWHIDRSMDQLIWYVLYFFIATALFTALFLYNIVISSTNLNIDPKSQLAIGLDISGKVILAVGISSIAILSIITYMRVSK